MVATPRSPRINAHAVAAHRGPIVGIVLVIATAKLLRVESGCRPDATCSSGTSPAMRLGARLRRLTIRIALH
jgi:hypothetical protein